jgi:hypothetical protein
VLLAAAALSYSIVTGGAIGLSAALAASSEVADPNFPAQTSSARGVTINITPKNLASNAGSWEFAVVLDTHSQDLSDDLVKSSLLLDGAVDSIRLPPGTAPRRAAITVKVFWGSSPSRPGRNRLSCKLRAPGKTHRVHSGGNSNEIAAPSL